MAAANYLCFVICPIGEPNSEKRQDYDDLLEFIIKPALEVFPFDIRRGDHTQEAKQIHDKVVENIQQAALCIADISEQNVNVYYEIGRRQETMKPIIFLKRRSSEKIAVDLGNPDYTEYSLDDRYAIRDSVKALRSAVKPYVDQGMDQRSGRATLADISNRLTKIEQKLSQLTTQNDNPRSPVQSYGAIESSPFQNASPVEVFTLAAQERDIQMMDNALDRLRYSKDEITYLDVYASVAASMGSSKGGRQLIDRAEWFFDNDAISFHKKIEYLGCLVSYLNKKDEEFTYLELVEELCNKLIGISRGEPAKDIAQIYNQRNRLYHGIYVQDHDEKWLKMAIDNLEEAKKYVPKASYVYFNLATCYDSLDDKQSAKENVMTAVELDGEEYDEEHLFLACKILSSMGEEFTPEYNAVFKQLEALNPVKARLLDLLSRA